MRRVRCPAARATVHRPTDSRRHRRDTARVPASASRRTAVLLVLLAFVGRATAEPATGGADAESLAKQLANPVASLISVPFQNNWDFGMGLDDEGWRWTMNVQPVVPFSLGEDWNLISRTILPLMYQDEVIPDADQFGLGDTVQSLFLSPSKAEPFGLIFGVGPVALLPTATRDVLSAEKWGAGPTAVVLKQVGPWTLGMLANHIWSFAGAGERNDVDATFLQPFVTYTTKTATGFVVNTESTYDWKAEQWSVPLHAGVTQVLRIGGQLVQVGVFGRYWAETPLGGPEWGVRLPITLLFPR